MLRSGEPGAEMGGGKDVLRRCRWDVLNVICHSVFTEKK